LAQRGERTLVRHAGARADAARAVALAPANFSAQLSLGQILMKLTEFEEAEQVFQGLAERYPRGPSGRDGFGSGKEQDAT